MKLLFFSDLHAHNWSQFHTRLENGLNSRLNDCVDILRQAVRVVQDNGVDHVLFLGDLFECRTAIDVDVFFETFRAMRELSSVVTVWLLKGNHDCHNKMGDVYSIEAFRDLPNVIVLDEPKDHIPGIPDVRIAAYPYMADVEQLKQHMANMPATDLVLLHQSIREGTIGPYNTTIAAELSLKDLPLDRCRYVFAGDYHKRQFFGPDGRVHYIGSPLQLKADEVGEEKGFTLLDTNDWSIVTVPTVFPKFHLFATPAQAAAEIAMNNVDTERDFIRIKYTAEDQATAEEIKASFTRVQIDEETDSRSLARTSASITDSDFQLCQEYADQKNESLPEDTLMSVAMELLEGE
jgi:DNA repair exonuclease SbcCD nuclease subunit